MSRLLIPYSEVRATSKAILNRVGCPETSRHILVTSLFITIFSVEQALEKARVATAPDNRSN